MGSQESDETHLLEVEFFHPRLIWSDGCALHCNRVLQGSLRRINGDLVLRLVPVFYTLAEPKYRL